jgi:BON domain
VRIDPSGAQTVVATGLSFPSAMTFGPDGALYVSNFGFGAPEGVGQIVRIELPRRPKNGIHATGSSENTMPSISIQQPTQQQRASSIVDQPLLQIGRENSIAPDDETLQRLAAKRLTEDSDTASVSVNITEARAVLTGTVKSSAAKLKAEKLVKAVRGVKSIDNGIVVAQR